MIRNTCESHPHLQRNRASIIQITGYGKAKNKYKSIQALHSNMQLYTAVLFVTDEYQYLGDLLRLDACRPQGELNALPEQMNGVITPLRWKVWERALGIHPDRQFRDYIVSGIREGF